MSKRALRNEQQAKAIITQGCIDLHMQMGPGKNTHATGMFTCNGSGHAA